MDKVFMFIDNFWHRSFLGITWGHLILALLAFVIFYVIGKVIVYFVLRYLKDISEKSTDNVFDHNIYCALRRPLNFLVFISALYFFLDQLELTGTIHATADKLIQSLMVVCFFWFVINLIRPFSFIFKGLEQRLSKPIIDWLIRFIKIILVFTALASVLQIWGIQIGPIIAGMGLFSVALALGAQDLFKNLIAGIVILAEKRFVTGDRVSAGGVDGNVERIGFRSTRIRTLDKVPIYVPNTVFSDQALTNFSGQSNRRIKWNFGLVYGTTSQQLKTIVNELKAYIKGSSDFIYDDNVVYVTSFGDSSIDILVNVLIVTAEYGQLMRAQQNLIFKIMDLVETNGSDFAFPSQSLYIEKLPKGAAAFPFMSDDEGLYETTASKEPTEQNMDNSANLNNSSDNNSQNSDNTPDANDE